MHTSTRLIATALALCRNSVPTLAAEVYIIHDQANLSIAIDDGAFSRICGKSMRGW